MGNSAQVEPRNHTGLMAVDWMSPIRRTYRIRNGAPARIGLSTGAADKTEGNAMADFVFDPYSPAIDADPFPAYRRLRDEFPCFWSPQLTMWVLSRHADISAALQDWQTYSSAQGNLVDELPGRAGSTLGSTDPPRHDRLRAPVQSAFSKRMVDGLAEPIRAIADRCLDGILEKGAFDFVEDFSSRITVETLFTLMGLPHEDHSLVRRRVVTMIQSDPATRQKGRSTSRRSATWWPMWRRRSRSGDASRART